LLRRWDWSLCQILWCTWRRRRWCCRARNNQKFLNKVFVVIDGQRRRGRWLFDNRRWLLRERRLLFRRQHIGRDKTNRVLMGFQLDDATMLCPSFCQIGV